MNRKLKLDELNRVSVEEFVNQDKFPIKIILDNIRSMNNIGSVFRTADALNVSEIALCGLTAQPPHRDIHKTALGATDSVQWNYFENTIDAISQYKKEGYKILSIEQVENSMMLNDLKVAQGDKFAIVMGNEVTGVQQEVVDNSDAVIEVPQFGTKHSLNISVCTGVVLWDIVSKMNFKSL